MDVQLIRQRVDAVRENIRLACERAGRHEREVTLVAVTKTFRPEIVRAGYDAGLRDFGENKAQEFVDKLDAVGDVPGRDLRWHFIGHLQRNKIKLVAGRTEMIHGVDSLRLARALQDFGERDDIAFTCLIQVNVSGEASKFGLDPGALRDFLAEARAFDRIRFQGLMTLASPTADEARLRHEFRFLKQCLLDSRNTIDTMNYLSMGMTSDFAIAVEEGATHVRIGSALFGERNP
jgi:hypothetical protein